MEFSLHAYVKRLRDIGASPDYIDVVRRNALPLVSNGLPVVLTLGHLAAAVGVPYGVLHDVVQRRIDPYRVFAIRKRSGGRRFICVPESAVLNLQQWIHKNILLSNYALKQLSVSCTAYMPGSSHIKNAQAHLGADWLLKLDISNFFESVSERQVYYVFRTMGYRALVAFCLARLCTRVLPPEIDYRHRFQPKRWKTGRKRSQLNSHIVGHLPQGAPTSPMLANLVCASLDQKLQNISKREGLSYTRYADDIVFSGSLVNRYAAEKLTREVSLAISEFGFSINGQKTAISKNGGRKIVTGISIDGEVIRLPKVYKDKVRQELYYIKKYGLKDHCLKNNYKNHVSYLASLHGRIAYAGKIEPDFGEKCMALFSDACPEYNAINDFLFAR